MIRPHHRSYWTPLAMSTFQGSSRLISLKRPRKISPLRFRTTKIQPELKVSEISLWVTLATKIWEIPKVNNLSKGLRTRKTQKLITSNWTRKWPKRARPKVSWTNSLDQPNLMPTIIMLAATRWQLHKRWTWRCQWSSTKGTRRKRPISLNNGWTKLWTRKTSPPPATWNNCRPQTPWAPVYSNSSPTHSQPPPT